MVEEGLILKAARAQGEARKKADEGDFEAAQSLLRTNPESLSTIRRRRSGGRSAPSDRTVVDGLA